MVFGLKEGNAGSLSSSERVSFSSELMPDGENMGVEEQICRRRPDIRTMQAISLSR